MVFLKLIIIYNHMANKILVPIAVLAVCASILGSAYLISNRNLYIKNIGGSSTLQNDKLLNTISASGDGKVYAKPDMATFSVGVSETASTSAAALDKANAKINEATALLLKNGIDKDDIQTSNYNLYTDYDYNGGYRKIIGQRADIRLSVKVRGIDEKATKVTKAIDELSKIEKIEIGSISFDIENKKAFYTQARELAFAKAKQKAEELADLGDVKLLKPVSMTDQAYDYAYAPQRQSNVAWESVSSSGGAAKTADLSTGQLEINLSLQVIWGIE